MGESGASQPAEAAVRLAPRVPTSRVSASPPLHAPRAAYVHVPFCAHRCGYCDFTVVAGREDLVEAYLAGLATELAALGGEFPVETLYVGGGTPTQLAPAELAGLLALLHRFFPLAPDAEFTVEANPANFDADRQAVLAAAGVNRVSLGVQAFEPELLRVLERDHTREAVHRVVSELRTWCRNLSLDLIFGIPGQTDDVWRRTLDEAVDLAPEHLSTYGLTFEKGTQFWNRRERGELAQVDDGLERAMYEHVMERLPAAGWEQYEISSFARPGFRSRHNQVYWSGRDYFGVGPGAASFRDGVRRLNHRSFSAWLKRLQTGRSPVFETETLSPEDRARERLVLGLRTCDGVARTPFAAATGFSLDELAGPYLARHVAAGHLLDDGETLRLTPAGRCWADHIAGDFL